MQNRVPPEVKQLSDSIGHFIEYWGFKKIHGRIWTHIFLSPEPIDAATLVRKLGVSKALVSLAVKDLLHFKVIEVAGKGLRRKIMLKPNNNILEIITNVLKMRELELLRKTEEAYFKVKTALDTDSLKINETQFENLGELICTAKSGLQSFVDSPLTHLPIDCDPED